MAGTQSVPLINSISRLTMEPWHFHPFASPLLDSSAPQISGSVNATIRATQSIRLRLPYSFDPISAAERFQARSAWAGGSGESVTLGASLLMRWRYPEHTGRRAELTRWPEPRTV